MDVLDAIAENGLLPVVVIENVLDAVSAAEALMVGGFSVMEITFRTPVAAQAIKAVVGNCPEMLVGAGTVLNVKQCKEAVESGAKFIVSPGFDKDIVKWCINNYVTVIPGCVTPTEIISAMNFGLKVVKFFPLNIYGGLDGMKSLSAPFREIQFIPTGGINMKNISQYISAPFVYAVGGSWVCPKTEVSSGNFENIAALCKSSRKAMLGYELIRDEVCIKDSCTAESILTFFGEIADLPVEKTNSFVQSSAVIKNAKTNTRGYVAVRTNCIRVAISDLSRKGFVPDMTTATNKDGRISSVYLMEQKEGLVVRLVQR